VNTNQSRLSAQEQFTAPLLIAEKNGKGSKKLHVNHSSGEYLCREEQIIARAFLS
jgi:hypothetical protein